GTVGVRNPDATAGVPAVARRACPARPPHPPQYPAQRPPPVKRARPWRDNAARGPASVCALHTHTPTLSVTDPRGLPVRSVFFHRTRADESATERVDRSGYDPAGRLTQRWDPRLWRRAGQDSGTPSNLSFILSLTAQPLLSERVDAGWDVAFCGSAGERRCRW
nr:hypothetical protein [Tanacetum cinerariifolium]